MIAAGFQPRVTGDAISVDAASPYVATETTAGIYCVVVGAISSGNMAARRKRRSPAPADSDIPEVGH
jgi:hypothetical protein